MKYIYSIHHYLGTFFFGMFSIWFLSGFVMMYKSFPFLSEADRIKGQEVFRITDASLPHPASVFADHKEESSTSLRINSILGKPVYHLATKDGTYLSKFAHTGALIQINESVATQIAKAFTGIESDAKVARLEVVDQWIPRPKYAKHLPVYKVQFEDDAGTYVHISSKTGEVISNTSRSDRVWAWLGAIPHWIYLKEIRMRQTLWSQLCIWLSVFGFIMALSGIITGIVRFKKKPRAKFKRFSNKWYNVHYYTGLLFGVFICTWIFSGFMSMSPFNWSYDYTLSEAESRLWEGETNSIGKITTKEWENFRQSYPSTGVKEAHFSTFSDALFATVFTKETTQNSCVSDTQYQPTRTDLSQQIEFLDTSDPVVAIDQMNQYDTYYYDRHNAKKLPVLKATTANQITYYLDPSNGTVLLRSGRTNKIERWLYHGLHSWDYRFLTANRPLWDILMISLLLGGTAVCITAVGLGIKFAKRKRRKYARA